MTKLFISHDSMEKAEIEDGLNLLCNDYDFLMVPESEAEIILELSDSTEYGISLSYDAGHAGIRYDFRNKNHFFRALSLLLETIKAGVQHTSLQEEVIFPKTGAMFDLCQGNFALNMSTFKMILRRMAVMGMNVCMLYCEDTIEVPEEPFLGYMRAQYSFEELKELDDYAFSLGIELVPAVQTLAHLHDVLKWDVYRQIREDDDCLVPESEETYQFIRHILTAASAPFRSRRIHIGMDEAMGLGRGTYMDRNGSVPKVEIMRRHLRKVLSITEELGLEPILFSDMFGGTNTADLDNRPDPEESFPELYFNFWNYYKTDPEWYRKQIKWHKKLGKVIFSGGIWTWKGFGPNWGRMFNTTEAALKVCREENITEIIATTWGDSGTESDFRLNLFGLQYFAEHAYHQELQEDSLKRRLSFCTGMNYEDVLKLRYIDEIPGVESGNPKSKNPSKYLLWQDPLCGLFDENIRGLKIREHYEALEKSLREAIVPGPMEDVFRLYDLLTRCLIEKCDLGIRILDAYRNKDTEALYNLETNVLPNVSSLVTELRKQHLKCWQQTYKIPGMEILDMRYGALLIRLQTAAERLKAYRTGEISSIEELEGRRLPFNGEEGIPRAHDTNSYGRIVSAGRIAPEAFLLRPIN